MSTSMTTTSHCSMPSEGDAKHTHFFFPSSRSLGASEAEETFDPASRNSRHHLHHTCSLFESLIMKSLLPSELAAKLIQVCSRLMMRKDNGNGNAERARTWKARWGSDVNVVWSKTSFMRCFHNLLLLPRFLRDAVPSPSAL
ncbi:hypothetical protein D9619_013694 [Psilocybe cf. subviscida]|uniref:Uncharacterized protein n=1 Tax=Psilocybe cf. subviscida TaxID=2480587 RepID=A0A8H5EV61_9AGAR|nr:hypothetical protein D9619_013694 [Psilocybe cf. subviscida]